MSCICAYSSGQLDGLTCVYCGGTGEQQYFPAPRPVGMPDCADPQCRHPYIGHGIGGQKDKTFCYVPGCRCPEYQQRR